MEKSLLEHPLVPPTDTLKATAPVSQEEAARLLALDPPAYWMEIARELTWDRPPTVAVEGTLGDFRYYPGATGNVSVNCLDRWPSDRVALLYEREDGLRETWTFGELTDATARFAAALQDLGVQKGDRVAIYLGNVPEAFIAIHACYRIGAIYSVIFAGFSASAVRDRLEDARPKVVVCTDATLRRGKVVPLKATLDEAMEGLGIPHVIVARRVDRDFPLREGEQDFHALLNATVRRAEPVPLEANEPGFIIYTSGTTSKPKGLVHAGIGFLAGAYANVKWALNLRPEDVYWCTADVGWLTFPIFALVGGLAHGATHVIYEGGIDTPTPARPYEVIERYGVNKVFTAPTALRMLRRAGDAALGQHDLNTLELISLVGEPLDPETWHWTQGKLGAGRIFLNNTYGQTETGTAWASSMVGLTPTRPGSCGHPLPGYRARVVRDDGQEAAPGELGALTLTEPFPCLARTVWGDHARYVQTYLSDFPGSYAASDAALVDADGQLWVTGRLDDVMNVAGHRIGTMEMEAALITHPAVSEAAVVAQPDEVKGSVPVAFVVPRGDAQAGPQLEDELAEAIVRGVGPIARPARVIVTPTVPRTRSGKIMRRLLRDLLVAGEVKGDLTSLENPDAIEVVKAQISSS
ncbi:acetate--CoA ligase [Deinococcus metallilatus]|uniref:acetate--CoA ligase n=1 Tax=Deinococcus metallilatus TaxID=1211322 RepID=A0AAJ5K375_9DEIO|nr:acetate--CoA ligase [Deinococcus metallilatus]MBB5295377.1 acetyl-CoA synthetase [Deinococcus metallilatus]QBY08093.1 acetate--CoA ligase [Deinococcus metallilatus]RXJ12428.1 acetate--CoA ligase [Deinococcus metallilatus]TLK21089.1 acetate--CoA ligase [Deinococcus metallilatus]GMA16054.1 acetyl-CoA synthase [Deinococcus metallilatus]